MCHETINLLWNNQSDMRKISQQSTKRIDFAMASVGHHKGAVIWLLCNSCKFLVIWTIIMDFVNITHCTLHTVHWEFQVSQIDSFEGVARGGRPFVKLNHCATDWSLFVLWACFHNMISSNWYSIVMYTKRRSLLILRKNNIISNIRQVPRE